MAARLPVDGQTSAPSQRSPAKPNAVASLWRFSDRRRPQPGCEDAPRVIESFRRGTGIERRGPVVVYLDGSADAEAVLPAAVELANASDAEIRLVHVVSATAGIPVEPSVVPDVLASGYLRRVAGHLPDVRVDWEVLHGRRSLDQVATYARQVGSRAVALNLLGHAAHSLADAERLGQRSGAPVLVTRHRAPRTTPTRPSMPTLRPRHDGARHPPTVRVGGVYAAAIRYQRQRAPTVTEHAARPPMSRGKVLTLVAAMLAASLLAASIELPYVEVTGSAVAADDVISVRAPREHGEFLILIAQAEPVTAVGAARAWFDPRRELEPRAATDSDVALSLGRQRMRESLQSARTLATRQLGLNDLPVVELRIGELGGPSAGLAFALTLADLLTTGDLTGGRTIAVTGQLGADGEVQAVGRMPEKARAAQSAGADVLIVPIDNASEAAEAAPALHLIAVASFQQAVDALRDLGGGLAAQQKVPLGLLR